MLAQLLIPIVIGFTAILLVLVIAYSTYCYFVRSWKKRRISGVATIHLI
jgi:uncharacterized membrane protein YukC